MKLNSISGITCYVEDLSRTAEFYEAIGFRRGKEEPDVVDLDVEELEDFHTGVLSKGMQPEGEPEVRPSGNREFVLRDPDGYKLVLFQEK
jgi:hypothetical protein